MYDDMYPHDRPIQGIFTALEYRCPPPVHPALPQSERRSFSWLKTIPPCGQNTLCLPPHLQVGLGRCWILAPVSNAVVNAGVPGSVGVQLPALLDTYQSTLLL